ncbi:MAG: hypothetical protein KDI06_01110 [Calditrichaeota bacterium]|nr:hypothetical protein [Calditrichota bacterium]
MSETPTTTPSPQPEHSAGSILEALLPTLEMFVQDHLHEWSEKGSLALQTYQNILEELHNDLLLIQESPKDRDNRQVWVRLENSLKAASAWTEAIPDSLLSPFFADELLATPELQTLPDTLQIPIPESFWDPQSEEDVDIRFGKRVRGLLRPVRRLGRWIRRKPPAVEERFFNPRSYFVLFAGRPAVNFLLEAWPTFLQTTARQLYELHKLNLDLKDTLLATEHYENSVKEITEGQLNGWVSKLSTQIEAVFLLEKAFERFEEDTFLKFHENQETLFSEYRSKWDYAGTFALRGNQFDQQVIEQNWQGFRRRFENYRHAWDAHFTAERGEWQKDLELGILQIRTRQIMYDVIKATTLKVDKQISPVFEGARTVIRNSLEQFEGHSSEDPAALRRAIVREIRELHKSLQQEKLPMMMDALVRARLEGAVDSCIQRLGQAIESMSEESVIFEERDLSNLKPKSEVHKVALKDIVEDELFRAFKASHKTFSKNFHERIQRILMGISTINDIAEFNLGAGLQLTREERESGDPTQSLQAVQDGLNRAMRQVSDLIESIGSLVESTNIDLLEIAETFDNGVGELAGSKKILELQLRLASARAREEFRHLYRRSIRKLRRYFTRLLILGKTGWKHFNQGYQTVQVWLGIAAPPAQQAISFIRFLTDMNSRVRKLPYVYQRLFELKPLSDERFYMQRTEATRQLKADLQEWIEGNYVITSIISERGNGRTTLLNLAKDQYFKDFKVVRMSFTDETIYSEEDLFTILRDKLLPAEETGEIKTLADLENHIVGLAERRVFIVENIQNLFLRTVDGFDTLESFMLFIARTSHPVFWVLSCTTYSWFYLDKVIGIQKYTRPIIDLGSCSDKEVREIILKRHRVSGYRLHYELPPEIAKNRRFRRLDSDIARQEFLEDLFFKDLTQKSAGNISVAILLWLSSVTVTNDDTVSLPATISFDNTVLYNLPAEELFTLAAILQHASLNADNHARIFHLDKQESQLLLNRLQNRGYLEIKKGMYHLHPLVYRPAVQALQEWNIIY